MADSEFEEFSETFDYVPQHINSTMKHYKLVHDLFDEDNGLEIPRKYFPKGNDLQNFGTDLLHDERIDKISKRKQGVATNLAEELSDAFKEINITSKAGSSCGDIALDRQRQDFNIFYSPDSDQFDSGNSTSHSPDFFKSVVSQYCDHPNMNETSCEEEECSVSGNLTHFDLLEATHRALYKFIARHSDELDLEIGDPIYVQHEAEDLWCEGMNLRNNRRGIFPSAYVVDVDYNEFEKAQSNVRKERFLINYLGSVETLQHRGHAVLNQAIQKITNSKPEPRSCVLEISDRGLRMLERKNHTSENETKGNGNQSLDYFYSLKNISFCASYPQDARFLGFITKHPKCDRFACHVYFCKDATDHIAESIGRAFSRFYEKFVEMAYPVEDIYIDE